MPLTVTWRNDAACAYSEQCNVFVCTVKKTSEAFLCCREDMTMLPRVAQVISLDSLAKASDIFLLLLLAHSLVDCR